MFDLFSVDRYFLAHFHALPFWAVSMLYDALLMCEHIVQLQRRIDPNIYDIPNSSVMIVS